MGFEACQLCHTGMCSSSMLRSVASLCFHLIYDLFLGHEISLQSLENELSPHFAQAVTQHCHNQPGASFLLDVLAIYRKGSYHPLSPLNLT